MTDRPIALITGASRRQGIASAIVEALAADGWDIATTYWRAYEDEGPNGGQPDDAHAILVTAEAAGARAFGIEADLSDVGTPGRIFDVVESELGSVAALVLSHCVSFDSGIEDTTVESFDRHFSVNARASWLLIREFGRRFAGPYGSGRIVALTSDDYVGNVPYGSSKGALDRIVLAAAKEFHALGVTANALDPGPVDDGWMSEQLKSDLRQQTPLGRLGTTKDPADFVRFLCSSEGGWVNGQVLKSNGGIN